MSVSATARSLLVLGLLFFYPSPGLVTAEVEIRAEPSPSDSLTLRVGLATDLPSVTVPPGPGRILRAGEDAWSLGARAEIAPRSSPAENPVYRLQVASLKDEGQARGIAQYLTRHAGASADAVFDAGTDLYKVRYGRFKSRREAEPEIERLAGLGLMQAWVTSEGGTLKNAGFSVRQGKSRREIDGRWLEIRAPEDDGVEVLAKRYRGRIFIFLNDRGLLNVINALDIEDYLRGVVPREMGPELYNQIEALKAQTVAARTYALRNLGEFSNEGYDICSTPRCQVYGGMKVEHPLSDRAIAETAGQVALYGDEPAETFYGATCGGHTENVQVVFPRKRGEYLRGVPCMEAGVRQVSGDMKTGLAFPAALVERLVPSPEGVPVERAGARLAALARLAGLSVARDELASLERAELRRFLASVFDLALDPRLLSGEVTALLAAPPIDWRPRDFQFASYVVESGLVGDATGAFDDADVDELLLRLALGLGVLRHEEAHFHNLEKGRLEIRLGNGRANFGLGDHLVSFRRRGAELVTGPVDFAAGDRVEIYWHGPSIVALIQPVEARRVSLKRHAPRQRWSRHVSHRDLARAVQTRYPGFPFQDFEVLTRGVSGRVGRLKLLGVGGESVTVEGLAVRWTLDIPDTLFEARRKKGGSWHFQGRGWGHGVGMCQAGAFGMAMRRLDYREILQHYYSGVEIALLRQLAVQPRTVLGP